MKKMLKHPHLLVVDDDERIRTLLKRYLFAQGFLVSSVTSVKEARRALEFFIFDCLIVDIMMPQVPGTKLLSLGIENLPPILFLTAMGKPKDRVYGLQLGAEDYLTKPFEPEELLLRIQKILRSRKSEDQISFGPYQYTFVNRCLKKGWEIIVLTEAEQEVLEIFLSKLNDTVSRQEMAQLLKCEDAHPRTLDVRINRLRQKIEEDPKDPQFLKAIRGEGYCLRGS